MLRSTGPVGMSSTWTALAAVSRPFPPGWMLGFRDWVTSGGSQPISSSRPTSTSRSAFRSFTASMGLASTKCGSAIPLERLSTETRFPPTSRARAASPSTVVTTCKAALSMGWDRQGDEGGGERQRPQQRMEHRQHFP